MKILSNKEWKQIQEQEAREKELKRNMYRFGELSSYTLEQLKLIKENLVNAKKEIVESWKNDPILKNNKLSYEERSEYIGAYENEIDRVTREILLTDKVIHSKENP